MVCPECRAEYVEGHSTCPVCQVALVEMLSDEQKSHPEDEFVQIARFDTRLEAEAIGHALDQYDIPFLVKGDDIGIFGPGHVMATPQGSSLWVPASRRREVVELLSCVVTSEEESE